ncbi:MAG: arylesterase [Desulfobacteraceae bacterium]|nr:arylesterase [Desulfobacteraceae bacterium]
MKRTFLIYAAVAGICLWLFAGISAAEAKETRVLFLGDSITAGLGVEKAAAYPAVVGRMLKQQGIANVTVINAGISGSTTASGVSRLRWHLKAAPHVLILALGANDGLRGLSLMNMAQNLDDTIALALENHLCVILAGMEIPPNYGPAYTGQFRQTFRDLAEKHDIALIPFLLDQVGGVADMNQADGIHPNTAGHRQVAATVLPYIKECL